MVGEAGAGSVATCANQVRLGAAAGRMGSIPRTGELHIGRSILGPGHGRIALAISVSEHGDARAAAGPVSASEVHVGRKGTTVLVRTSQDVLQDGRIAPHLDR